MVDCPVFAQNSTSSAGKTIMAQGEVAARNQQELRTLVRRSPVFSEDLVSTGQESATQLRMVDGALLSMQASSELSIASYEFDAQTKQGNINMSLLKGGLKTITGVLQQRPDNYKLITPVASIGVRGTHYEAELIDGDLYLAGWKGIIDIKVSAGNLAQQFSLGPTMAYKFAIVRADGSVEFLLQTPLAFSRGYSRDLYDQTAPQFVESEFLTKIQATEQSIAFSGSRGIASSGIISANLVEDSIYLAKLNSQKYIDNEQLSATWLPNDISRQGSVVFDRVELNSVGSSLGQINDFSMSMTVDFDSARIPTGNLSFTDQGGEWFAAFDGIINQQVLDLSVNFASHDNNLANGSIDALLIDKAQGVLGNLSLRENDDANVSASGAFLLRQANP
jgi:hypothetical protein